MKTQLILTPSVTTISGKLFEPFPSVLVSVRTQSTRLVKIPVPPFLGSFQEQVTFRNVQFLLRYGGLPRAPAPGRLGGWSELVSGSLGPGSLRRAPPLGGRAGGAASRGRGGVTWAGRARRPIARCDAPPEAGRALKMAAGAPSGSARQ